MNVIQILMLPVILFYINSTVGHFKRKGMQDGGACDSNSVTARMFARQRKVAVHAIHSWVLCLFFVKIHLLVIK